MEHFPKLIKAAMSEGKIKLACYLALCYNQESGYSLLVNGDKEHSVNLDSAYSDVSEFITKKQWSGYLSALTDDRLYLPQDRDYGTVIIKSL